MNTSYLLEKLEIELRLLNAPTLDLLKNGIDEQYLNLKTQGLEINLPVNVKELYMWKNGIDIKKIRISTQGWLFPLAIFSSIEDSIDRYLSHAGKDGYWQKSMFMVFESTGGDFFLIECDEASPDFGTIFFHSITNMDFEVIISAYDSLENLLKTLIESYGKGIFYFDTMGTLKFDYPKFFQLSKELNPKSEKWKLYPPRGSMVK